MSIYVQQKAAALEAARVNLSRAEVDLMRANAAQEKHFKTKIVRATVVTDDSRAKQVLLDREAKWAYKAYRNACDAHADAEADYKAAVRVVSTEFGGTPRFMPTRGRGLHA